MKEKKFLITLKAEYFSIKHLYKIPTRKPTPEVGTESTPEVATEPNQK